MGLSASCPLIRCSAGAALITGAHRVPVCVGDPTLVFNVRGRAMAEQSPHKQLEAPRQCAFGVRAR